MPPGLFEQAANLCLWPSISFFALEQLHQLINSVHVFFSQSFFQHLCALQGSLCSLNCEFTFNKLFIYARIQQGYYLSSSNKQIIYTAKSNLPLIHQYFGNFGLCIYDFLFMTGYCYIYSIWFNFRLNLVEFKQYIVS